MTQRKLDGELHLTILLVSYSEEEGADLGERVQLLQVGWRTMEVCVNLRDCLLAVEIQCVSLLWEVTLWWRTMRPCVHVVYVSMCHPRDGGLQRSSVCHSNRDIEVTNSYIIVDFQIQICSFSSPRIFSSVPAITRLHLDIQLLLICDLGICGNALQWWLRI